MKQHTSTHRLGSFAKLLLRYVNIWVHMCACGHICVHMAAYVLYVCTCAHMHIFAHLGPGGPQANFPNHDPPANQHGSVKGLVFRL